MRAGNKATYIYPIHVQLIREAVKEKKALVRRDNCTVLLCLVDKKYTRLAIVCNARTPVVNMFNPASATNFMHSFEFMFLCFMSSILHI